MKFNQIGKESGDCTAPYSVEDFNAKTVGEFINEILKEQPHEWGYIGIKNGLSDFCVFGSPKCEYRYGKLIYEFPNEWLNRTIESVTSSGGWSRMDYLITVK